MAKKKKLSFGLVVLYSFIFLIVGFGAGFAGRIYLFANSYIIPDTIHQSANIAEGDVDVDVVKNQELSIHFLELGNKYTGDCVLIKVGDVEVLVDAGSRANSVETIYNYVSQYVEGALDYVIVTHAHQDHYAGFATGENTPSLFDKFNTKTVITFAKTNQKSTSKLYSNFTRELNETKNDPAKQTGVYNALECYNQSVTGAQRVYDLGNNVSLQILYQKYYVENASSENDYSVCFMLNQNDEKYYLFTGDLETDGEASLVDEYKNEYGTDLPKMELYKAGHHGSKTSSSNKLLSVIDPEIVCICCCAGSSEYTANVNNQFPTQDFINRIAKYTTKVYLTTLCIDYTKGEFESFNGNIIVYSNSTSQTFVACANNSTLLKDTDWFKQNRTCPAEWLAS